jgi:hypothetical protein
MQNEPPPAESAIGPSSPVDASIPVNDAGAAAS